MSKKEVFCKKQPSSKNSSNSTHSSKNTIPNDSYSFERERMLNLVNEIKRSTKLQDDISKIEEHLNKRPPFLRVKQSKKKIISVTKHGNKQEKFSKEGRRYGTHIYQNNLPKINQNQETLPSESPYYIKPLSSQGVFKILKNKIPNVPNSVQQKWKSNSFTTVSIATFGRKKFKIKSISSLIASAKDGKCMDSSLHQQLRQKEISQSLSSPLTSLKPNFLAKSGQEISRTISDSRLKYLSNERSPSFGTLPQEKRNTYRTSPSIDDVREDFSKKMKAFFTSPNTPINKIKNQKDASGLKQYFFSKKPNSIQKTSPKRKIIKKIQHQLQSTPQNSSQKINLIKNASTEFRKTMMMKGNMRQKWTSISSSSSMLNQNSKSSSVKKSPHYKHSPASNCSSSTSCTPTDRKISLPQIIQKKNQNKAQKQQMPLQEENRKAYKYTRKLRGNLMKIFNSTVGVNPQLVAKEPQTVKNIDVSQLSTHYQLQNNNTNSINRGNLLKSSIGKCLSARNNNSSRGSVQRASLK